MLYIYCMSYIISHLKWKCWILIGGELGNIRSVTHLTGNVPPTRLGMLSQPIMWQSIRICFGLKSYKDSITKSSNVFTVSVEFFPLKWHIIYCNPSTIEGDTDKFVTYLTTPFAYTVCYSIHLLTCLNALRKTWFNASVYYG